MNPLNLKAEAEKNRIFRAFAGNDILCAQEASNHPESGIVQIVHEGTIEATPRYLINRLVGHKASNTYELSKQIYTGENKTDVFLRVLREHFKIPAGHHILITEEYLELPKELQDSLDAVMIQSKELEIVDMPLERFAVLMELSKEREYQDQKWGGEANDDLHTPADWCGFLQTYLDKAKAAPTPEETRQMLTKVGALAVAALESYDRAYAKENQPTEAQEAEAMKALGYGTLPARDEQDTL